MRAFVLGLCLLLLAGISLGCILFAPSLAGERLVARIYQDGELIETIDLSLVEKSYSVQVDATDGGYNIIEVRPGAIGMIEADCPDGLCVAMSTAMFGGSATDAATDADEDAGFSKGSLLPIVCLPHGLVIEITKAASTQSGDATYDIITY